MKEEVSRCNRSVFSRPVFFGSLLADVLCWLYRRTLLPHGEIFFLYTKRNGGGGEGRDIEGEERQAGQEPVVLRLPKRHRLIRLLRFRVPAGPPFFSGRKFHNNKIAASSSIPRTHTTHTHLRFFQPKARCHRARTRRREQLQRRRPAGQAARYPGRERSRRRRVELG